MRFESVLIDPPWPYQRTSKHGSLSGYCDREYSVLDEETLAALPVGRVCSNVLALWTTAPMLPMALRLLEVWGLSYVTSGYWYKSSAPQGFLEGCSDGDAAFPHRPHYGVGYWLRGDMEQFLVAKVPGSPSHRTSSRATFVTRAASHSEKPDTLHQWFEKTTAEGAPLFPGNRLELFARRSRPGWTCLGNEIDGRDIVNSLAELADR